MSNSCEQCGRVWSNIMRGIRFIIKGTDADGKMFCTRGHMNDYCISKPSTLKYKVVQAPVPSELTSKVEIALSDGWELYGDLQAPFTVNYKMYIQVLTKRIQHDTEH